MTSPCSVVMTVKSEMEMSSLLLGSGASFSGSAGAAIARTASETIGRNGRMLKRALVLLEYAGCCDATEIRESNGGAGSTFYVFVLSECMSHIDCTS